MMRGEMNEAPPHTQADRLAEALREIAGTAACTRAPIAPYTAYGIGGAAALWVVPSRPEAIGPVLSRIHGSEFPLLVLGRGTNVLVSDQGWPGAVLYIGENLSGFSIDGNVAEAWAGTLLIDLVRAAVDHGLGGMERLAGIPGSVGGALQMNAGAFGQEIAATCIGVTGYRTDGTPTRIEKDGLRFGYRLSPCLDGMVIVAGRFRFQAENDARLRTDMDRVLSRRAASQPLSQPSCGSVFKRPSGHYAGALIEAAGLKGETVGGAMVSPKHAGFIVNTGKATATDVYRLIRRIEDRIANRFGVHLEREVRLIGDFHE